MPRNVYKILGAEDGGGALAVPCKKARSACALRTLD